MYAFMIPSSPRMKYLPRKCLLSVDAAHYEYFSAQEGHHVQEGSSWKGHFSCTKLVRLNLQPQHNGKDSDSMRGHKFKMARDQGCRAIYENQTWIPANETKAEGGFVFWSSVAVSSDVVKPVCRGPRQRADTLWSWYIGSDAAESCWLNLISWS